MSSEFKEDGTVKKTVPSSLNSEDIVIFMNGVGVISMPFSVTIAIFYSYGLGIFAVNKS